MEWCARLVLEFLAIATTYTVGVHHADRCCYADAQECLDGVYVDECWDADALSGSATMFLQKDLHMNISQRAQAVQLADNRELHTREHPGPFPRALQRQQMYGIPGKISDYLHRHSVKPERQVVHIMGQFHSGTHDLQFLMLRNLPDVDVLGGDYGSRQLAKRPVQGGPCDFWKHTSLSRLRKLQPETLDACSPLHVKGVAIVRNPLAWLSALKADSGYDVDKCSEGHDWLVRNCSYRVHFCYNGSEVLHNMDHCYMDGLVYPSLAAIWNLWTKDYEQLSAFGFEKAMSVRYEDLVLHEEDTLAKIAHMLDTSVTRNYHHVRFASRAMHGSNAQSYAVKRITSKSYLKDFTQEELKQACSRLDQELMLRYGYDDCQTV